MFEEIRVISKNSVRVRSFNGWHTIECYSVSTGAWYPQLEPMRSYARVLDLAFEMI